MNKPSQYIPLWKKIEKEKIVSIETAVPERVKKAIMKRKLLAQVTGRLHFRTEVLRSHHEQRLNGDFSQDIEEARYILHIVYTLPQSEVSKAA